MAVKRVNADLEVAGEVIAGGENLSRKIEYLEHLVPEAPLPLAGLEFENVAGGVQSGGLADDGVVDHYAYGLNAGDIGVGNIIRDSSPTILTLNSNRFDRADEGLLKLYINEELKETLDLTVAGDENGRLYQEGNALERIEITIYNDFEPFKKGHARIHIGLGGAGLQPGANKVRLVHEIEGAEHGSGELILFYDDGAASPALSTDPAQSLVTASEPGSPVTLSGVKYLPDGAAVHVKVTAAGVFVNTFHPQPLTLQGGEAGFADEDVAYVAGGNAELSGYSDPPQVGEPFVVEKDITLNQGLFSLDARVRAVVRDPFGETSPALVPRNDNLLVNTLPQQSTDLVEKFTDEVYRLPLGAYDSVPGQVTGQWDGASVLTNGNAQVAGALIYPQTDYSTGHLPATGQPDYSTGFSGEQRYIRAFRALNDPHNSGILKLVGLGLSDIEPSGDVKVEIKLPGLTGWLDLGLPFDAGSFTGAGGDGCRTASSEDEFSWTAGTFSTADSGCMVVVRVTLKNSLAPALQEMQMTSW